MSDYDVVLMDRMYEYFRDSFYWTDKPVSLKDIEEGIKNSLPEQSNEYDDMAWFKGEVKPNEWHIGRIIYLINHPEKITPIQIDNQCWNGMITAIPIIEDGHHRYLALLYQKRKTTEIIYGGRKDVLDYLTGKIDQIPFD